MNEKSIEIRKGELFKYLFEEDWMNAATKQLRNNQNEVISQAKKFLQDERMKGEIGKIESQVPDQFSPSEVNVKHLNGWQKLDYEKGIIAAALSVCWALNQSPNPSNSKDRKIYVGLNDKLQQVVDELLPKIESISSPMATASFSPSSRTLSIYYLPSDWIPGDVPKIMEPLKTYMNLEPEDDLEDSVLHEMTHAYIRENTRKSIPIHDNSDLDQILNQGQQENLSNEPAAIDEAAAHAVSSVISSTKKYNAREYENKGEGLPRDHVHTAFKIFLDVAKQEENPYQAIGTIRDLAAKSIDKYFKLRDTQRYRIWEKISKVAANKIGSFERPETPLDHLKILAEEKIADFDAKKYEAIEEAARAFEKSERYSVNFLVGLGLVPIGQAMEYGEHVGDAVALFPTPGEESDPYIAVEGERVQIDIEDLEKGIKDLEKIPKRKKGQDTKEVEKDLRQIVSDYQENKKKFRKGETTAESEEKQLEEEEKTLIAMMTSYEATGPDYLTQQENNIAEHLLQIIDYRLQMLQKGKNFTQEMVSILQDTIQHIDQHGENDAVSGELKKLRDLSKKNLDVCKKGLKNLNEAEKILEKARKELHDYKG